MRCRDDAPVGRIGWVASSDFAEARPWCESPRHVDKRIPAAWVMAYAEPGAEPIVQAMCGECMDVIARDLGTSPVEGQMSRK